MNCKKIISLLCMSCLIITLCACGKSDKVDASKSTPISQPQYTIGVLKSASDETSDLALLGFAEAINDNFPDENVTISTIVADDNNSIDAIADEYIQKGVSLIYAIGEEALLSATARTSYIPIVASSVMDYHRVLGITDSEDEWDKTTGINVTGVSSTPNISDTLSMMIELTPNMASVGILTLPDDPDASYQNSIMEGYLSEAGIPWKAYEIYSGEISDEALEEIVSYACSESSVLYIASHSGLYDKMGIIGEVASAQGIPTVGGDERIGEYTLCSMYNDPFDQGYKAGEMARNILANKDKVQNMKIKSVSSAVQQKLYRGDIAASQGLSLPKSFTERSEFLMTYIPGSRTNRDI